MNHQEEDGDRQNKCQEKHNGRGNNVWVHATKRQADDGIQDLVLNYGHIAFLLNLLEHALDQVRSNLLDPHLLCA